MKPYLVVIALTGVLLASCLPTGPGAMPEAGSTVLQPTDIVENDEMTEALVTPDPIAQRMVDLAKEKLAGKLGIAADQVFLFEVTPAHWPDASLGCPLEGVAYDPISTPGFVVILEAQGQAFTFHTDTQERVILCDARPPTEIYQPP